MDVIPTIKHIIKDFDQARNQCIHQLLLSDNTSIIGENECPKEAEKIAHFIFSEKRNKFIESTVQKIVNVGTFSFGQAIAYAREGKRVARKGWNGKDMWISYSPGYKALPAANFWSQANREHAEMQPDQVVEVLSCLTMKTADNKILMGWLASQTDMLADDWQVVA